MTKFFYLNILLLGLSGAFVHADDGESEARRYFKKTAPVRQAIADEIAPSDHYLALHLGSFIAADSYQWGGTPHTTNTGRLMAGLTYKGGPLSSIMDWALRADFLGYQLPEGNPVQLSFSWAVMFPESSSQFPLYFGIGLGPGVFLQQIPNESFLSLQYSIFAGARLFNVLGNTGFFLEGGLKNHFLLLTDGQFNGTYLSGGAVFVF